MKVKAQQPNDDEEPTPKHRNTVLSTVRLFQVDVAARDERSDTGWTFGSFIYDGRGCVSLSFYATSLHYLDTTCFDTSSRKINPSKPQTLDGAAFSRSVSCGVTIQISPRRSMRMEIDRWSTGSTLLQMYYSSSSTLIVIGGVGTAA